ncbi:hypothetical protein CEUSTIGMA_g13991.t1 [Chlamydomonas eustigma]|nr:hypothetical protein CEUSTIGMA_g13991.t1 [Chlamydomonas eustigma]|eukprot:GAX86583.1 hypothetical protein CEUSTIGMA_g13991.t1 [Chlamydomonas eustigma]
MQPHTVHTAASDIIALLRSLKIFPHALVGHSFGGKVVMGMVQQFANTLPRPLQVWVLDSLPGDVRAAGMDSSSDPEKLISLLRNIPLPIKSRTQLIDHLLESGFSKAIAQWVAINLRPAYSSPGVSSSALTWSFDLDGIRDLYRSYEATNLYPLLESPPLGLRLDFVKAEHSSFRWSGGDEEKIMQYGHRVHLLPGAGHWVHTDNPTQLYNILAPSFGGVDMQQRKAGYY